MGTSKLLTPGPLDTIRPTAEWGWFYTYRELRVLIRKSRRTIMRWVRAGTFPAPVQISANRLAWRDFEIEQWCRSRPPGFVSPELSEIRRKNGLKGNAIRWNWPSVFDGVEHHWIRL